MLGSDKVGDKSNKCGARSTVSAAVPPLQGGAPCSSLSTCGMSSGISRSSSNTRRIRRSVRDRDDDSEDVALKECVAAAGEERLSDAVFEVQKALCGRSAAVLLWMEVATKVQAAQMKATKLVMQPLAMVGAAVTTSIKFFRNVLKQVKVNATQRKLHAGDGDALGTSHKTAK